MLDREPQASTTPTTLAGFRRGDQVETDVEVEFKYPPEDSGHLYDIARLDKEWDYRFGDFPNMTYWPWRDARRIRLYEDAMRDAGKIVEVGWADESVVLRCPGSVGDSAIRRGLHGAA